MPPEFLTPAEVAERLKISKTTVLTKVRDGDWECTKISDRIFRFTEDQYQAIAAGTNRRSRKSNRTRLHDALKKIA